MIFSKTKGNCLFGPRSFNGLLGDIMKINHKPVNNKICFFTEINVGQWFRYNDRTYVRIQDCEMHGKIVNCFCVSDEFNASFVNNVFVNPLEVEINTVYVIE